VQEGKKQRFWIVGHDLIAHDSYPTMIGNQLDKNKQPKTPEFSQISENDLIIYYAFPEKVLVGIFRVTSKKQTKIVEKEDNVNRNDIHYFIEPFSSIEYFVDITKLSMSENKFESFPNGLLNEKFPQSHICREISSDDITKFKNILLKKEYSKEFSEENSISIFSALLEFYGNRATSFVQLFVASIFGIVTLSAIIQFLGNISVIALSIFPYIIFSFAGYYTLERYFYYVNWSEKVKMCLEFPNRYFLYRRITYNEKTEELDFYPEFVKRISKEKSTLKLVLDYKLALQIAYAITIALLALTVYLNALMAIYP
jgi:hypothetical protein